tara:strand:+ start:1683 stop:2042 length:360 start_codon:yes stop_codon:yes gene_type:complete
MFNRVFARVRGRVHPGHDSGRVRRRLRHDMPGATYTEEDRRREFRGVFHAAPAGGRVLAQLLDRCRVCDRSFVPGDSLETARREGMRDIGLWLLDILEGDPPARARTAEADPVPPERRD